VPPAPPTDSHHDDKTPVIHTTDPQDRNQLGNPLAASITEIPTRSWNAHHPAWTKRTRSRLSPRRPDRALRALKPTDTSTGWVSTTRRPAPREVRRRLAILQPARGRERQRLEDLPPPRHQPAGLVHPGCAATARQHRQRSPSCPFDPADSHPIKTHFRPAQVITIRDHPTRPQRTSEAPTRPGVMPHQPHQPGPSS
jgi:hypothetical protein